MQTAGMFEIQGAHNDQPIQIADDKSLEVNMASFVEDGQKYDFFFLDEDKGYFYYPYGLYSAGHAQLDLTKTDIHERMIQKRDRSKTVILGDSGGFQVAKGVIKLDWEDAIKPDSKAREDLCEKMLRWMEYTADWSMTLDFPAFAAIPPYNKKTGLTDVKQTIDMSMYNLDYFVKNRVPGATKFLNVLSGADDASAQEWFDLVTPFNRSDRLKLSLHRPYHWHPSHHQQIA